MKMRLQTLLARSGAAPSRRKAEPLISSGRVTVNGKTALLGESVAPTDRILLDGHPVMLPPAYVYLALNKPKGYLTTLKDERNRPTVADIMPKSVPGLVPVGRLDAGTEGLLLLTNDGRLAHHIAHPSSEIEKEYELILATQDDLEERLAALEKGPELDDGKMLPPKLSRPTKTRRTTTLSLTVHEGRNRIIRRACSAVGLRLLNLKRIRVGPVKLKDLPKGRYRPLTPKEMEALR